MLRRFLRRTERAAVVTLPVSTAVQEIHVVLGLQWQTVLGTDLHTRARRKARAAGATHWVHAGGRAESVGMAWLPSRAPALARRTVAHAGAQLFARSMPAGIYVLAWALDDGRYWVAMARDGQVLGNGDAILPSREEALAVLHRARMRFGDSLRCLGAAAELLPAAADEDPIRRRAMDLPALAAMASAASLLQPVRVALYRLPAPVIGLLLMALAGVAVQTWWRAQGVADAPEFRGALEQQGAPHVLVDAQAEWSLAIARQTAGLSAVTPRGLQQLWAALGRLPVMQSGWGLQRMHCDFSGAEWRCTASYRRLSRHALARGFTNTLPPHWRLHWDALDSVQADFIVSADASALPLTASASAPPGLLPAADALQPLRPLLRRVDVGRAGPLALVAPLDANGVPLPRPVRLEVPVQRPVTLEGPWRSIVVAAPALATGIAWQRVEIDVQLAAQAGLATSTFMASLYGVSYENRFEDAVPAQPQQFRYRD